MNDTEQKQKYWDLLPLEIPLVIFTWNLFYLSLSLYLMLSLSTLFIVSVLFPTPATKIVFVLHFYYAIVFIQRNFRFVFGLFIYGTILLIFCFSSSACLFCIAHAGKPLNWSDGNYLYRTQFSSALPNIKTWAFFCAMVMQGKNSLHKSSFSFEIHEMQFWPR